MSSRAIYKLEQSSNEIAAHAGLLKGGVVTITALAPEYLGNMLDILEMDDIRHRLRLDVDIEMVT